MLDWKDLRGPFISAALEAGGSRILSTAGRKIRYRFPSSKLSTRHVWEVTRRTPYGIRERRRISAVLRRKLRGPALCAIRVRVTHALPTWTYHSPCATGLKARERFRRCASLSPSWTRFLANIRFTTHRNSVISFSFEVLRSKARWCYISANFSLSNRILSIYFIYN